MNFPEKAIAELLRNGLIIIRERAVTGDLQGCEIEADHLHNLPAVLESKSRELLIFYFEVERLDYLSRLDGNPPSQFTSSWVAIGEYLDRTKGGAEMPDK